MKKIFYVLGVILVSILLFGCGNNNKKDKEKEVIESPIEKTIKNLYTDDTKLVYDNGGIYKLVFYYSNNEITGLEHYYEYKDENEASSQYEKDIESLENNASIKEISKSGKYVVYTLSSNEYEGKTVEDIKNIYSFLMPVYKKK